MAQASDKDIEIIRLVLDIWKWRVWIAACTTIIILAGTAYAFLSSPIYESRAVIALKETNKGGDASRLFSQLGGVGGMVASQLGLGSTNLDKIEIILKGQELAESVIVQNNLLPILFSEQWNSKDSAWYSGDSGKIPTLSNGVQLLRNAMLGVSLDIKKNMIIVSMKAPDPVLAKSLVEMYLDALNSKIRSDVKLDAEINRDYLERQLTLTVDPILAEKIRSMVAYEIEKFMLVSSQAFEVLEKPVVPIEHSKPKRKLVIVFSVFLGLFISISSVFFWKALMLAKQMSASLQVTPEGQS